MMRIATVRSSVESRAVDDCFKIERRFQGTLNGTRMVQLVAELNEYVPVGMYTGLFGLIRVTGLSYPPEGGTFADVHVDWTYPDGQTGDALGVIHFLEFYTRFEHHLV